MSSRNTATGLADPNINAKLIVDIEVDNEVISLSSGTQATTIAGTYYRAAGRLLEVGAIEESNSPNGRGFSITLNNATSTLFKEALTAKLADNAVRVRFAVQDRTTQAWTPYDLRLGRVSQVIVGRGKIVVECYTPMTIANVVRGYPSEWTDDHQRNFVDGDDYIFRFISESSEKEVTF